MRELPFTFAEIKELNKNNPTPFYVYDEEGIVKTIEEINRAFAWNQGFMEHFAVKALPNPSILKLLHEHHCGSDCASIAEIELSKMAGIKGQEMIFTSNQTQVFEYQHALDNKAIINLDAYEQIAILEETGTIPETICLRYNPGKFMYENYLIGELQDSKFGMTHEQIFKALAYLKNKGVKHFGIHAMLAGNILDEDYYPNLAKLDFELCLEIKEKLAIKIEFIDLAGGVGIPYLPDQKKVNMANVGAKVHKLYDELVIPNDLKIALHCEMGRYLTGPHGYLVSKVVGKKDTYKHYLGVDACAANLLRPAMYKAYHEIICLNKENETEKIKYDVVGALCENNDKLAIDRQLPKMEIGDYLVFLDAGAHSHSMGYQYNGRLRSSEFLYQNKTFKMIRRKEELKDYFSTLDINELYTK